MLQSKLLLKFIKHLWATSWRPVGGKIAQQIVVVHPHVVKVKLKQKVVPSGKKLDIFVDDEDRANLQAVQVGLLFSRDDCPAPKRTCIVI